MAGRPDFSNPGSQGSGQVLATNNRPEVKKVTATQTGSVAASSSETTEVYAPTGSIYNVLAMQVYVPSDATATSGQHVMVIRPMGHFATLRGENTYAGDISYDRGHWNKVGTDGASPPDEAAQAEYVRALRATENSPITILYQNQTDAAQDNNRKILFVVEEVSY